MQNDQDQSGKVCEGQETLPQESRQILVDMFSNALRHLMQKPPQETNGPRELEIDLVEILFQVLSKIHYVIIAAVFGAVLMGAITFLEKPVYSATSKLYIAGNQGTALSVADLQKGSMLTMDYKEVFRTWEVHEMVRSQLGLDYSYDQMQDMLSVSNPKDTHVLMITVCAPDAQLAAELANAYAAAAKKFILQTMDTEGPNVFSVALIPSVALQANKAMEVAKGFFMGGGMMCVGLVLFFALDERPRTPEHIRKATSIPTLAIIPAINQEQIKNEEGT